MTQPQSSAKIVTGSDEPEAVSLEQFLSLALALVRDPKLHGTLTAVMEKLTTAQRLRWTGKIEIDLQTGEVRGGPVIKAV